MSGCLRAKGLFCGEGTFAMRIWTNARRLSIQAGENPRVIEEKLKSFLAPSVREGMNEENEGGE